MKSFLWLVCVLSSVSPFLAFGLRNFSNGILWSDPSLTLNGYVSHLSISRCPGFIRTLCHLLSVLRILFMKQAVLFCLLCSMLLFLQSCCICRFRELPVSCYEGVFCCGWVGLFSVSSAECSAWWRNCCTGWRCRLKGKFYVFLRVSLLVKWLDGTYHSEPRVVVFVSDLWIACRC